MTIKWHYIQYPHIHILSAIALVGILGFVLANNYYQFIDTDTCDGLFFGAIGAAFVQFIQTTGTISNKKLFIKFMLMPATNLEKFLSCIITGVVIPLIMIGIMNVAYSPKMGTFFATQIGVEKRTENMEKFQPEGIECSGFFHHETYRYRNDSVVVTYYGRFRNVEIKKQPDNQIKVGISSSHLGDLMLVIGISGILIFFTFMIKNQIVAVYSAMASAAVPVAAIIVGREKVFYSTMSIADTENFILIISAATAILGVVLVWIAYRKFCNKQIN